MATTGRNKKVTQYQPLTTIPIALPLGGADIIIPPSVLNPNIPPGMVVDDGEDGMMGVPGVTTVVTSTNGTSSRGVPGMDGEDGADGFFFNSAVTGVAGLYTPVRSAETNLDSNVTMFQAQYMQVGNNTVGVSGRFTADPTAPATPTSFEMTLPVASNIGAVEDVAGVAFCGTIAGMGAAISGSVANNTMVVSWVSSDVTSQSWQFAAIYRVI